ncbi:Hsp70 family protein [Dactylosporangium vinaceum]|uniref:Hsp70 family protein n=1 Tax=Dactylosporangium vinaceum TaxID=53362 RepID=A0ABV5M6X1_9ACTN|nr:Hsp70 family protein [Dactylosporangium vinaceum]UAB97987.1 Hsp70 family protein [Dactylosporangium vinaceum]
MPTPGIRLGVDFGTSNTVAVVRWPDGRSRPLVFDGSPLLPSAVYAEPGGAIIVGRDAVHSARLEPARFEPNPKRRIDDGTVLLGDREIPVGELIAAVLRRVRDEWARSVGGAAPDVTITVPASWGATRRLQVADAAVAAGLGQVRLVPEPVAAAAYFTQVLGHDVKVGSVVVVYDFGAGTFDASVVARTAEGFEVLAVDGRDDIGGIDFDNAVVKHIGTICEPRAPQEWGRLMNPQTVEDRRHRRLLFDDAKVAKERLSRQPASDLTIPLLNFDVHLTREELERLAQPMIEQTIRVTKGVMRWAQLSEGAVAGVFLVGGSSRMPLVATLLHRMLGTAPTAIEQPELVVAEGSMLAGSRPTQATAKPAPGPATGVLPQVPGFEWQRPEPGSAPPVSAPPVSAPPVSGSPAFSTPPPSSRFGSPVSAPPVSTPPASTPPVSAPPLSAPPVSTPPANGPVWPQHQQAVAPVSVPPPVSALPPVSAPPVSAPPNRPVSSGRVYQSTPEPSTRYDEYGRPFNADAASPPRATPPTRPPARPSQAATRPMPPRSEPRVQAPPPADYAKVYEGGRRPGPGVRALRTLLVIVLLVTVPLAAGIVSFYFTTDHWPALVQDWLGGSTP